MSVGQHIRRVRVEVLGLTQRELAEQLGIESVNISSWERGVAEPRIKHVREIASLADLPVAAFFSPNGAKAAA